MRAVVSRDPGNGAYLGPRTVWVLGVLGVYSSTQALNTTLPGSDPVSCLLAQCPIGKSLVCMWWEWNKTFFLDSFFLIRFGFSSPLDRKNPQQGLVLYRTKLIVPDDYSELKVLLSLLRFWLCPRRSQSGAPASAARTRSST